MYKTEIAAWRRKQQVDPLFPSHFTTPRLNYKTFENNRRSKETLSRHVRDFLFNDRGWGRPLIAKQPLYRGKQQIHPPLLRPFPVLDKGPIWNDKKHKRERRCRRHFTASLICTQKYWEMCSAGEHPRFDFYDSPLRYFYCWWALRRFLTMFRSDRLLYYYGEEDRMEIFHEMLQSAQKYCAIKTDDDFR